MTTDPSTPPTEAELHAWVDHALPADRAGVVQAWLRQHPEEAVRIEAWRQQKSQLQALAGHLLDEPIPPAMRQAVQPKGRRPWLQGLAAGVLLMVGFSGGWFLRPAGTEQAPLHTQAPAHVREAQAAHVVYVPEKRHPVEVGAQDEAHLVQWLSRRLGTPLKAPQLSNEGYSLMGGRLLAGETGEPRALFMYETATGQRLTLHVSALAPQRRPEVPETAFRFARVRNTETFYWVDGPLGYALSGDLPREQMARLAHQVYRQLQP